MRKIWHGNNRYKFRNMITEDYVSFETAKLLKEKGFDWECKTMKFFPEPDYDQESPNGVYAPTLQMAMKWLREVHDIHPNIVVDDFDTVALYRVERIFRAGCDRHWFDFEPNDNSGGLYNTYEEACEAGIKYCLENLI